MTPGTHAPSRAARPSRRRALRPLALCTSALCALPLLAGAFGCRSSTPSPADFERVSRLHDAQRHDASGFDPGPPLLAPDWYRGPGVYAAETGTARFVRHLHRAFRPTVAMRTVQHLDRTYRAAASTEYDQALDWLAEELRSGGYGGGDGRTELFVLESEEPYPGWQPVRARIVLHVPGEPERVLHRYDAGHQRDRVMLPVHTPSASVRGPVALALEDVREGSVLVTRVAATQALTRAESAGAAALLSAFQWDFNADPTGEKRHLDAIHQRRLPAGASLPTLHISPRSHAAIAAAAQRGDAEIEIEIEVELRAAPLRTLVAVLRGSERSDEAVVVTANVQEPGANDNASGVATTLEGALVLADLIERGRLGRPKRSIVFVFGDELRQAEAFLEDGRYRAYVGLSARMTGQSRERTGAIALLERQPDPGALLALPPDEHSSWGKGDVSEDDLLPSGLAVIARCAMIDVGRFEERELNHGWPAADHPWEGGSDHDVFLRNRVPAVLFWHFQDFTYRTSLDRPDMVDPHELRRSGVAILATALAIADPRPDDLARYVDSLRAEIDVRLDAAEQAGERRMVDLWRLWGAGARSWLRMLCLDLDEDEARAFLRTETPDERARRLGQELGVRKSEP